MPVHKLALGPVFKGLLVWEDRTMKAKQMTDNQTQTPNAYTVTREQIQAELAEIAAARAARLEARAEEYFDSWEDLEA